MKQIALIALSLCACAKEPQRLSIQLNASGRMCAIEYPWMGGIGHDTIIGHIDFATGDTLPGTGRWNTTAEEGEVVTLRACPLTQDTTPITLTANGDISDQATSANPPFCAVLEFVVHAQ